MPGTPVPQIRRLMSNDETVGMGFNSESGLAIGTPFVVDDLTVESDPNAPGQQVFSTITIINTHEALIQSIGMSLDAQGRYGFFSAALKAQFSESTSFNSMSTFLTAKVIVQNPFLRGRNFKLDAPAQTLIGPPTQGDLFKRAFGDSFVRGVQTGGEFYAVMRITSVSQTKQQELAGSLQAEYQGFAAAGSFKLQFEQANSQADTRSEFSGMMYQRAGTGEKIAPVISIEDVLERVRDFSEIAKAEPVAYEIEVATYDTLPLPLPTPEEQEDFLVCLRDARAKKLRYLQMKNDLEFAQLHRNMFIDLAPDEVLLAGAVAYTELLNAVMNHGIELATGRMRPPRMFEPDKLGLKEPAPIRLTRGVPETTEPTPPPPPAVLTMPDLIGRFESELPGPELAAATKGWAIQIQRSQQPPPFSTPFAIVPGVIINQSPPGFTVVPNQPPQNTMILTVFSP